MEKKEYVNNPLLQEGVIDSDGHQTVPSFILRRTKNEVLNELPEKTEITLKVNHSGVALSDLFR